MQPRTENANSFEVTKESTLRAEIKIYYDLYVPPEESAREAAPPLLVALHGYGANKRQMMREARAIAPEGFAIASLQGFHQHMREPREKGGPLGFGFGWVTNFHPEESIALHHEAINRLIDSLVKDKSCDRERVFLLGFSQSCALNYRYAFTYPERLRGMIGICGGLPGDWDTSELYRKSGSSVLHLHGTRDEFYPPARVMDYSERLRMRATDVEMKAYDAGHEIVPEMRQDVSAWLRARAANK